MPVERLNVFISSVQKELKVQRRALKDFLLGDIFLSRFISKVFLFEDIPAKDRRADQVYLEEVEQCDIYLGIFGYQYGNKDDEGISPTEHEFNLATRLKKTRLIYVWGSEDNKRDQEMGKLIGKVSRNLVRRRVEDTPSLLSAVYASIVDVLDERGALRVPPFDAAPCKKAQLKDVSPDHVEWFIAAAQKERKYPFNTDTKPKALLTHLNLLNNSTLLNAAVLLFTKNPQQFHPAAEIKCIHCHGTEYERPFDQHIYKGTLFHQIDQARDFVLSHITRSVGTRSRSATASEKYELPPDAVAEAIINAVAHRNYYSKGSVEVRLFADRLEIRNPGTLPETITVESLRIDHSSVPNNPLIAEPLYLTRYIEKAGSGTQMMIRECRKAGLPEPEFEEQTGFFVVTLWRDWLTDTVISRLNLNERQRKALEYLKVHERITNSEYQTAMDVSRQTATRDLQVLLDREIIEKVGTTGKGTFYILKRKRLIKGSKDS